jgi:predicted permease
MAPHHGMQSAKSHGVTLFSDLRQALRSLSKSRGYAFGCIAILALGIGANAAIFALLHSIILNPLPYPDAERLVFLWNSYSEMPEPLSSRTPVSRRMYEAWQKGQSFSDANPNVFPPFGLGVNIFSITGEDQTPGAERQLQFLLVAVAFFLLIACANLANLTLTRMENRSREIAIRRAMGATRGRIIRQLALESLLLATAGAALGLAITAGLSPALLEWAPDTFNRPDVFAFRWPVFAFSACATVLTTLLFGVLPAFTVRRGDAQVWLKSAGYTTTNSGKRSRQALTTIEVALSVVLLVGAGLMLCTVINFVRTPLGVDMELVGVAELELSDRVYPDDERREQFLLALINRVRQIPGVQSAAVTTTLPMVGRLFTNFTIEGQPKSEAEAALTMADHSYVTPGYLNTVGIQISAGRGFNDADLQRNRGKGEGVALVNKTFVQKFFDGQNPIGRRLEVRDRRYEIVGVTADFKTLGPDQPIEPQFFIAGVHEPNSLLVLRATAPIESLTTEVRHAIWSLDKAFVSVDVNHYKDAFYEGVMSNQLFALYLLGVFAVLGLLLAMTGVYTVLSHLVVRRRREIGVRMAIGASTAAIGRMVARQSLQPVMMGVVAGIFGSLALTGFLQATLFQVSPTDPLTIALASLAVLFVIPLAIWLPARRATRIECAAVLREE